jgi:hypothetical protein
MYKMKWGSSEHRYKKGVYGRAENNGEGFVLMAHPSQNIKEDGVQGGIYIMKYMQNDIFLCS